MLQLLPIRELSVFTNTIKIKKRASLQTRLLFGALLFSFKGITAGLTAGAGGAVTDGYASGIAGIVHCVMHTAFNTAAYAGFGFTICHFISSFPALEPFILLAIFFMLCK